jgi:hypothetical protein
VGIEPTDVGDIANKRDISTLKRYFNLDVAREIKRDHGQASVITATNCFAHIEDVHGIMEAIVELLEPGGVFISESHYLMSLLDGLQYDTIYHEHLRYYSIASLKYLFQMHDMELFHVRPIPTHGGSIRVYAAKRGVGPSSRASNACSQPSRPATSWRKSSPGLNARWCFPNCGCYRCSVT